MSIGVCRPIACSHARSLAEHIGRATKSPCAPVTCAVWETLPGSQGLDALGDDAEPQPVAELDGGADGRRVVRIVGHA